MGGYYKAFVCGGYGVHIFARGGRKRRRQSDFRKDLARVCEADFSMLNLENIFGSPEDYEPLVKSGPNLISSERYLNYIDVLHPTVLGLANNHARDYGDQALYDTMAFCQKNGYLTVGAGRTLDEAYIPLVLEKDGIKVSILAVAENEPGYAEDDHGGTAGYQLGRVAKAIREARSRGVEFLLPLVRFEPQMLSLGASEIKRFKNILTCEAHAELISNAAKMVYDGTVEKARERIPEILELQQMQIPKAR